MGSLRYGCGLSYGLGLLALTMVTSVSSTAQPPQGDIPQIPRDSWKDCLYNDRVIPCRDQQWPDLLRIHWKDGVRSRFQRKTAAGPGQPSDWVDRHGGLWRRELLPQGNTLLTQRTTGARLLIPLRFPCKPPLKGEVGYCRN